MCFLEQRVKELPSNLESLLCKIPRRKEFTTPAARWNKQGALNSSSCPGLTTGPLDQTCREHTASGVHWLGST